MREILFRGKGSKGIWHYGYFKQEIDQSCWIREKIAKSHYADFQVLPDSVGMFINWMDSNNNRLFEGDICLVDGVKYVIEWGGMGYWFKNVKDIDGEYFVFTPEIYKIERIGNRIDNPELLEAK